jgi:hypothetical protein
MNTEAGLLNSRLQELAQRIVEAARLAASAHLFGSFNQSRPQYGRRIEIGGAGPVSPDDAQPLRAPVAPARPRPQSVRDGAD